MRVLNVSEHDWANFAFDNMMSLRTAGVDCYSFTLNPHPFDYEQTSFHSTRDQMARMMQDADVIQAFHSPLGLIDLLKASGKAVVVYHTGTTYRQRPSVTHDAFKDFVASTVCALPELYLEAKSRGADPVYVVGGIEIPEDVIFRTPNRLRVSHHPSNPKVKGTETLRPLFRSLSNCTTRITTDRVPYKLQLQRIDNCDVYVEMMATMQGSAQYGSFGITALEAAARGKIVITNCVHANVYREHYGEEPFLFCNDLNSLKFQLDLLINAKPADVTKLKHTLYERFTQLHSHAATGKYIIDNVFNRIFKKTRTVQQHRKV